jgi:hypothetical protein
MEFQLKSLSPEGVPRALAKAERYRLLNEPSEAESICLDALAVDPDNQEALVTLLLALTEQFDRDARATVVQAFNAADRLRDEYDRVYYTGLIHERRAKAQLQRGTPGAGPRAHEWIREAMNCYERAEGIRPAGNDDAILRWNACARMMMRDPQLEVPIEQPAEPLMLE